MELLIVLMIPVLAVGIGWLYGRNDVDPYTATGKAYYNSNKETE
jgi:hypothetical protein